MLEILDYVEDIQNSFEDGEYRYGFDNIDLIEDVLYEISGNYDMSQMEKWKYFKLVFDYFVRELNKSWDKIEKKKGPSPFKKLDSISSNQYDGGLDEYIGQIIMSISKWNQANSEIEMRQTPFYVVMQQFVKDYIVYSPKEYETDKGIVRELPDGTIERYSNHPI